MNINRITSNYNYPQNGYKNTKKQTVQKNNVQKFHSVPIYFGRDLVKEKQSELPKELQEKLPPNCTIYDIIQWAKNDNIMLGEGANSRVYKLPFLDDYVLKVLNKEDPNGIKINEFPPEVNLGQPIWQDPKNPRLLILKRISGKEHSIPGWSGTIYNPETKFPEPVTKAQAKLFYSQLTEISKMPQATFDKLAKEVKILDEKGYKLDSINPNNLMVDTNKDEIHIIDYFKKPEDQEEKYQNCAMDLTAVTADFTLFPEYYDKLNSKEQSQLMDSLLTINQKIHNACEKAGLSCDKNKFKTYIRTTSRWFTAHSVPNPKTGGIYFRYYDVRMEDFLKMLDAPDKWKSERNQ